MGASPHHSVGERQTRLSLVYAHAPHGALRPIGLERRDAPAPWRAPNMPKSSGPNGPAPARVLGRMAALGSLACEWMNAKRGDNAKLGQSMVCSLVVWRDVAQPSAVGPVRCRIGVTSTIRLCPAA